jgi:hypothetical protein
MKNLSPTFRTLLYLAMAAIFVLGCGLFNSAATEREEANEEIAGGTVFGRVVTAEGIGEQNAPVGVTDQFATSEDFIYVIAEAEQIEEGTTMFARWFRDGEPFEDSTEITADRDYSDTYVEFHLENLEAEMDSGDYSVQLFVNGNPVEEVEFSVQ